MDEREALFGGGIQLILIPVKKKSSIALDFFVLCCLLLFLLVLDGHQANVFEDII